jgi:pimeloyl-ACP methyl ester carboxylesterase
MATFVLVHGAFQGGWVWGRVDDALTELGHKVFRPTLSGCGLHRDRPDPAAGLSHFTAEVVRFLRDEGLINVTLVGHSYAGLICCCAAQAAPDAVSRLILVDGVLPQPGKSFADMGGEQAAKMLAQQAGDDGLVRPWPLEAFGVAPHAQQWFKERLGPFPLAAFTEPCPDAPGKLPERRAFIGCIPAKNPLIRAMTPRAEAEGWETHALMSGHCAMASAPLELSGLLHSIVKGDMLADTGRTAQQLDKRLLEDMRRQVHWTCRRLVGDHGESEPGPAGDSKRCAR